MTDPLDTFRLENSPSHLLRRAHARAESIFAAQLAPFGITPRQKAVLITVYQHPGASLNEIAEHVALDRQTTAEIAARMVGRGFLEQRRSVRDRRAYSLWVTGPGEDLLREVMPLDQIVEDEVVEALPLEYRALFVKCLRLMAEQRLTEHE